jgi:hypothetical protein
MQLTTLRVADDRDRLWPHMLRCALALAVVALVLVGSRRPAMPNGSWRDPLTGTRLALAARGKHPYLKDHERVLFVESPTGQVRRVQLYPCAGYPVHSNLYRLPGDRLLLVDANGVWTTVAPTGEIESRQWCWGKQLPSDFLGAFQADDEQRYRLALGTEPEIYLFKDPP